MVTVEESHMVFGPFEDGQIYEMEKSKLFQKCKSAKTVEFVYRKKKDMLCFVEAKSSAARNYGGNESDYEAFLNEITEKFEDSFHLLMTGLLERRNDYGEISQEIRKTSLKNMKIRFILVIHGHDKLWLPPLQEDLYRKLKHFSSIWNSELLVLNDKIALEQRYISKVLS